MALIIQSICTIVALEVSLVEGNVATSVAGVKRMDPLVVLPFTYVSHKHAISHLEKPTAQGQSEIADADEEENARIRAFHAQNTANRQDLDYLGGQRGVEAMERSGAVTQPDERALRVQVNYLEKCGIEFPPGRTFRRYVSASPKGHITSAIALNLWKKWYPTLVAWGQELFEQDVEIINCCDDHVTHLTDELLELATAHGLGRFIASHLLQNKIWIKGRCSVKTKCLLDIFIARGFVKGGGSQQCKIRQTDGSPC